MKRSERGSSLVEMALIAPVLLFILFGIVDTGRAFSSYITMTNAVREGARYAARHPLETEIIQAKTLVEIGNADGSLKCDSPPEVKTEADWSGTAKIVKLKCTFGTITPFIDPFQMTATAAMKVEGPP